MDRKHTGVLLWIYISLPLLGLFVSCSPELPHVARYDVVRLEKLNVNGRTRRSASSLQKFPHELHFKLAVEGKNYTLHLEKNRDLIGKDYTLTHYQEDGTVSTTGPEATEHCYYHGHIPGREDSSVSVGLCSGMHGVVSVDQRVYLIEPLEGSVEGDHAIYRPKHLKQRPREKRGAGVGPPETDVLYDNSPRPLGMRSRASLQAPRFVELVVVVDRSEYQHYKSKRKVEEFILGVTNHVDKLYRPLNLRVILVGLEVWSIDQIVVTSVPSDLLNSFSNWQWSTLVKRKKHDNAQFVTGVDFEGSTVGLAFVSVMCFNKSGGVNQDRRDGILSLASTMAHEMGHNLGMSHDDKNCYCSKSDKPCVMADTVGFDYPERFSSCSEEAYRRFLQQYNPSCLLNRPDPEQVYGEPVCGNAFLEKGEECDCGTVKECTNPCCNATTCRLTEGSQCAEGECCQNCKFRSAGVSCRSSAHDCDLAEHCLGSSADCPRDVFRMNGSPCNHNHGYCYNGQCPSHEQQCRLLWGDEAKSCFVNPCTRRFGCSERQKKCENVQCRGGTGTRYSMTYTYNIKDADCKEITSIKDASDDLKRAPTGTKCDTNMVCVNGLCQDVSVYGTKDCADKCNNHGVCNHENKCHCDPGWAPPYCTDELTSQVPGSSSVVAGVCAAVGLLLVLTLVIAGLSCFRNSKPRTVIKERSGFRKARTSSGQANPVFQAGSARNSPRCGPPRISSPTFLESTATQSCKPLGLTHTHTTPARAAPQPPKKSPLQPGTAPPPHPQPHLHSLPQNSACVKPAKSSPGVPQLKPQVLPSKPAPPASKPLPVASHPLPVASKPQAPDRPLPPLTSKTANKPTPPPVPPVKPTASPSSRKSEAPAGQKMALIPPRGGR